MAQLLWKTGTGVPQNIPLALLCEPADPTCGCLTESKSDLQDVLALLDSVQHYSHEPRRGSNLNWSVSRRMDKTSVAYPYIKWDAIGLSKEGKSETRGNMDEP